MDTQLCRQLAQRSVSSRADAAWRAEMLAGQTTVRQSVAELGFLIAGLALALLLSEYWPGLAIVVAAALSTGAMLAVWRESRAGVRLHKQLEAVQKLGWTE